MKKRYYILYIVCLLLLTTVIVYAKVSDYKLSGKRIVIDVGHPEYSYTQDNEK